jgi:multidrug efflux pump subunit AcrA (membrane-fusion protein)
MPGMNCRVSLSEARNGDFLLAPKDAVFGEGTERHVFVARTKGKPEKRMVTTGANDGRMIEITEGLSEGEKILLQKPE